MSTRAYSVIKPRSDLLLHWRSSDGWDIDGNPVTVDGLVTGTFTRAGVKRAVDRNGRVYTVPYGHPALHHQYNATAGLWDPVGVLLEPVGANALTFPSDATNAAWTKTRVTAALTATGPDGVASGASAILETSDSGTHFFTHATASFTANTTQAVSLLIAPNGRTRGRFYVHDGAGTSFFGLTYNLTAETVASLTGGSGSVTLAPFIFKLANGWYWVGVSGKVDGSSTSGTWRHDIADDAGSFAGHAGDTTKGINFWCAQHEVDKTVPTSPMPGGSRVADLFTFPVLWLPRDLTVYVEHTDYGTLQVAGARLFQLGDDDSGTASSCLIICPTAGDVRVYAENASTSKQSDLSTGAVAVGDDQEVRFANLAAGIYGGRSINGAAETTSTPASAQTHPATYAESVLSLTPNAFVAHAVCALKIALSDRSLAQLQAAF